jgi:hypothetical protein
MLRGGEKAGKMGKREREKEKMLRVETRVGNEENIGWTSVLSRSHG